MKKRFLKVATALLGGVLLLTACGSAESEAIKIGVTPVPHKDIMEQIIPDLEEQGITVELIEFSDYTLLNRALADGEIDANFFQHTPFLEDYVATSGDDLVEVAKVHIEPMGIYSETLTSIEDVPDGAIVGIPNDATNEGRALLLLEDLGLITLKENPGYAATVTDIVENPKNLKFQELDAATLPRVLSDTDISVINTNYALSAGLNPLTDALAMEDPDSPYANVLVVRGEDKDKEATKKVVEAINSDKVRDYINTTYEGAIVPAF